MADEDDKKPASRARKASGSAAGKKAAAKKPAAKGASKRTASKASASKAKASASANQKSEQAQTSNNSHQEEDTFTKDPYLRPTGTLADKIWRLIGMTAFAFIANFAVVAVIVLAAVQFVVVLLDDAPNKEITGYMDRVQAFLKEVIDFLAFKSNEMPFPFRPFPDTQDEAR